MMLTDEKIRKMRPDSKKTIAEKDGNGLSIEVRSDGVKVWRFRYLITREMQEQLKRKGRDTSIIIGEFPEMNLEQARQKRDEALWLCA